MKLSFCAFNHPNGAIRWDKLKCLFIDYGKLNEDLIRKILSGSPCLETLELGYCYFRGCLSESLFENFFVERLSCHMGICKRFNNLDALRMKLSRCVLNPPNVWRNLNFLCIRCTKLDEDSIGNIISRTPCLETLELYYCNGVRRIDVASNSVKNLVLSDYGYAAPGYIDTLEIDAPYILSLTIKGSLDLEKILLLNISSLIKAELVYECNNYCAEKLGRTLEDLEDELLKGLLTNLGHVNEIKLRNNYVKREEMLRFCLGLDRHLLDHRPILLHEVKVDFGPTPFTFYHSWFKLDGFDDLVQQSWRLDLMNNLNDQKVMDDMDFIQKSKVRWEIEGDENSKYFHGIINKKRSNLAIRGVFVDGASSTENKISWISWDKVLASKKKKGLGLLLNPVGLSLSNDRWFYSLSSSGAFNVKDTRLAIDNLILPSYFEPTRWVNLIPIKINVFMWRDRRDGLPTKHHLARKGVNLESTDCPVCQLEEEDVCHLLFRCSLAQEVLQRVCRWWEIDFQNWLSFSDWDVWFFSIRLPGKVKSLLEGVFYVAWWYI
nr:RNA-directed DNA polymerase, eukaryota [Tanacetum cinerariifolium]